MSEELTVMQFHYEEAVKAVNTKEASELLKFINNMRTYHDVAKYKYHD